MAETLPCKLITQIAFKAGGDVFHELWANKPYHLPTALPEKIQACEILQGEHGKSDSLLNWDIDVDGIGKITLRTLQQINAEKKEIVYIHTEGSYYLTLYKTLIVTCHVETKGAVEFVIWTIEYELLKPDNRHPISLLNFCIKLTEDTEAHISK